ncbi:FMN-binding protein [Serpentinicella alkaliphila]|uniref:Uncharacterized protein with FMN-binding domain n=1 Tax=Serpentinicella alkaliphila TaxID=1734049 RepID=A0A4R2TVF3_9FIRM|nr:FMN-binding protein [Serpentinicella alkaliphila]QUH25244.1 FMN-binding protein [Serpentinicella alkaliphila]TCQ07056.1 uncharacterized protein with FMN-binding domain [Serpentinicella alkaliphila]
MRSFIKFIALCTVVSITLLGCNTQKDTSKKLEDSNTKIEISETNLEDDVETEESDLNEDVKINEVEEENQEKATQPLAPSTKESIKKEVSTKENSIPNNQNNGTSQNSNNNIKIENNVNIEEQKEQPIVNTNKYKDGTYKGSAMGYEDTIDVTVSVVNGKINKIDVTYHDDTPSIAEKAFKTLSNTIISSQELEVDAVSGATHSSNGFINAVKNSLNH